MVRPGRRRRSCSCSKATRRTAAIRLDRLLLVPLCAHGARLLPALPLLPFVLASGDVALAAAVGLSSVSLVVVGAVVALFSGGAVLRSALRMLLIGLTAAGVTWVIGRALGVAVS